MTTRNAATTEEHRQRGVFADLLKRSMDDPSVSSKSKQNLVGSTGPDYEALGIGFLPRGLTTMTFVSEVHSHSFFAGNLEETVGGLQETVRITTRELGRTSGCEWILERISKYERKRDDLKALIKRMLQHSFSWGHNEEDPLTPETAKTAIRFLELLPSNRSLPKIAPDGDGGLMMAWDTEGPQVVVGVSDECLYAVVAPGTEESRHFSEQRFDKDTVPPEILEAVPERT